MSDTIHILACTNRRYVQHAAVMLTSLLANSPGSAFEVVVVSGEDLAEDWARLERTIAQFPRARLRHRSFRPDPGLHTPVAYSPDIFTRLWVEDFFGPEVGRVLYLDSDLVVLANVAALWREDLGGKLLGATDIPGATKCQQLGMPDRDGYFNSGVMLIDLARWRAIGARAQVMAVLGARGIAFDDPDQDALNLCFHADRHRLDYRWNVITPFYRPFHDLKLGASELEAIKREARIIHYNGASSRPWSYQSLHPRKAEYYRYLAMTEWRGFMPPDRTPVGIARKHLGPLLPAPLKRLLKPLLGPRRGTS